MARQSSQRVTTRSVLLFICGLIAVYSTMAINAQDRPVVEVDFGSWVDDPQLQEAIRAELERNAESVFPGTKFAIASGRFAETWVIFSAASLDGPNCSDGFFGAGNCGTLILGTYQDGLWQIAVRGSTTFHSLLDITPESLIDRQAKRILVSGPTEAASYSTDFKFPWPNGVSWEYRDGWHPEPMGLDIGTRGTGDRRVLAAADGVVTHICDEDEFSHFVRIDHGGIQFEYYHIEKGKLSSIIEVGKSVKRGTILGLLRDGTFNEQRQDRCGHANQLSNSAHLHWVLPKDRAMTVDGWTINGTLSGADGSVWKKGNETKVPRTSNYDMILSTNAQVAAGDVGGVVRYSDGTVVQNATVEIEGNSYNASTKTNSNGTYTFYFLPVGQATVKASDGNTSSNSVSVSVVADASVGANMTIPGICTPRTGEACPPAPTDTPTPSRTPNNSPEVVLYAQINYVETLQRLPVGVHDVPNRTYYSMFVPAGMSVTLHSADNRSRCFDTSQHNLQDHEEWYKDIDRVQVHPNNACPATATPTPNAGGVVRLFSEANYSGQVWQLPPGTNNVEARNYYSIDMPDGWSVRLFEESGRNRCFDHDIPNLQDHEEWWRLTRRVDVMTYNGCGTASGKIRLYRVANYGDLFRELSVGSYDFPYNTYMYSMRIDSGMSAIFHAPDGRKRCWNEDIPNLQDHESWYHETIKIDVYGYDACPKPTATHTATFTPTSTPPPTPTDTPRPPTATPTKTRTPMPSPLDTPTPTPTVTRTKTPTPTLTPTPTPRRIYLPAVQREWLPTPTPTYTRTRTPTPTYTRTPTPTPVSTIGVIAFASARDGNWNIYRVQTDGSSLTRLTSAAGFDWGPNWHPNGSRLAFVSDRDGDLEVYTMNADGTGLQQLTSNTDYESGPSWSPDGSRLAYKRFVNGNYRVYLMNADGSNQVMINQNSGNDWRIAWSPDGGRLALTQWIDGNDEIYLMNADGSNLVRLTNNPATDNDVDWSPDGKKLVFTSNRDGDTETYVMNVDGSGLTQLTNNQSNESIPVWSPDGSQIAFMTNRDGYDTIYIMNSDGSAPRKLLAGNSYNTFPAWRR